MAMKSDAPLHPLHAEAIENFRSQQCELIGEVLGSKAGELLRTIYGFPRAAAEGPRKDGPDHD